MTIYSKIYQAIEAFENQPFENVSFPKQTSSQPHASVSVDDEHFARMTEAFINKAMKLMPQEFQRYSTTYYQSSVKLIEYKGEQKVNAKFIQALKKASREYADILAGEWTEYSKAEIDKEKFIEKCNLETILQKFPDSVIFAKKGFNSHAVFYRSLDRRKEFIYWNHKVTIVYSEQSKMCYIAGERENVLKVIEEIKTEMQMIDQPKSLSEFSIKGKENRFSAADVSLKD